jgi:hypothetical protein
MNKILRPNRSFPTFLSFLLIFITACGLAGCGHTGDPGDDGLGPIDDSVVGAHVIPIALARQYTASFRASVDSFNKNCPSFKDSMQFGHAEAFPNDVYRKLMKQKNEKQGRAYGIRIYFGRGPNGEIKMVLVPYDKNGNDMIDQIVGMDGKPVPGMTPIKTEALKVTGGQAIEDGQRCPTACDDGGSGLN